MSIPFSMVGPPPIPREDPNEAYSRAQMALAAQNRGLGNSTLGETTMGVDGLLSGYYSQPFSYQKLTSLAPAAPAPVESPDAKPPSESDRFAQLIWDDPDNLEET